MNARDFTQYKKEILVDKIVKLEELGFSFLKKINRFKPYGIGNTKPVFIIEDLQYEKVEILGNNSRDHLRFHTKHGYKIFGFGF